MSAAGINQKADMWMSAAGITIRRLICGLLSDIDDWFDIDTV